MEPFEKIYELYFKDVYRYLLSMCRDPAEAEEIAQETFFQAMKNMSSFRGECRMTVWLCQIAKHIYYASRKKQKRRQDLAASVCNMQKSAAAHDAERMQQEPFSCDPLERMLCDKEDAMRIHELLHQMEEPYKEVFMLRVFGELPFKKIAHIFGKTENWARVTYHRAKLKLSCEMEESNGKDIL